MTSVRGEATTSVRPAPRALSTGTIVPLDSGWSTVSTAPNAEVAPWLSNQAIAAPVPGTVAQAVAAAGSPVDRGRCDESDWWYRCTFPEPREPGASEHRVTLRFDGLATLAEVWLNKEPVLESDNMFVHHEIDVTDRIRGENELLLCFRSLAHALQEKRPRPRWKTRLVANQRLRWFRTSLLGHIPAWAPDPPIVGPWRAVWLEVGRGASVRDWCTSVDWSEGTGLLRAHGVVRCTADCWLESASLEVDGTHRPLTLERNGDHWVVSGDLRYHDVEPWWPNTHGEPRRYPCTLHLHTSWGHEAIDCGMIGFRSITLDRSNGAAQFVVNGVPVFCRGACWTPSDVQMGGLDQQGMRATLECLVRANANMVRVGGTMVYESDAFYEECDRLGLMVWQDFMFASLDYPTDDPGFAASVRTEIWQQLHRLAGHPSVVAFCGGSEVEQQAAMFGAPRDTWHSPFFRDTIRGLVEAVAPGTPYWPSSPTGSTLPFHIDEGIAHYFGVGAYRRPIEDCRLAGVKFATECLAFSHIPETLTSEPTTPTAAEKSDWSVGVPRDSGADWDFADVRDHYLEVLHGLHAAELRGRDPDHYLRISRAVPGRVMARVYDEWRSRENACAGALVWYLRDLQPGAGWGILDHHGHPKATYYYLRRAWAPRRVLLLDRGLDGLRAEVVNESAVDLAGTLEVLAIGHSGRVFGRGTRDVRVPARETIQAGVEDLLGYFADSTYAYRFGPSPHVAFVAHFHGADGSALSSDVWWTSGLRPLEPQVLSASSAEERVVVETSGPVRDLRMLAGRATHEDNYVDIVAGRAQSFSIIEGDLLTDPVSVEAENAPMLRVEVDRESAP